jgi:hypothetical protein
MLLIGRNDYRWIEYSVSASLMPVLIAILPGISDAAALIAIFGANVAVIFFWAASGALRAARREVAAFLAGQRGWRLPLARDRGLSGRHRNRGTAPRVRLRDLRLAVSVLHVLRRESVAAIPADPRHKDPRLHGRTGAQGVHAYMRLITQIEHRHL